MKPIGKKIIFWACLIALSLLVGTSAWGSDARVRRIALSSSEEGREVFIERTEEVQEEAIQIIRQNRSNLFQQMDQLGHVQEELGRIIRDHASLKFQLEQEIESVRAGLEEAMAEIVDRQIRTSRHMGNGQVAIGRAILASRAFPPGTVAYGKAQEQLGRAIRDNAVLQRQAAEALEAGQERLVKTIRDHATFLVKTSEALDRAEERLGRMILLQAEALFAANEAVDAGHKGLRVAIREGAISHLAIVR